MNGPMLSVSGGALSLQSLFPSTSGRVHIGLATSRSSQKSSSESVGLELSATVGWDSLLPARFLVRPSSCRLVALFERFFVLPARVFVLQNSRRHCMGARPWVKGGEGLVRIKGECGLGLLDLTLVSASPPKMFKQAQKPGHLLT